MSSQNRVQAGVPTGGQFAASERSEAGVSLAEDFPAAPLTPADVERLTEYRGAFAQGYDAQDINRVLGGFESARLTCMWGRFDSEDGYTGDSEIIGVAMERQMTSTGVALSMFGGAYGAGHTAPTSTGAWRPIHPDAWEFLSDPDTDIDPERIPSLLADEAYSRQDIDDLGTDGFHNVAAEAESAEETCAHCEESLADNEGYDGYCGDCADKVEAHLDGDHEGKSSQATDCPACVQGVKPGDSFWA